jgi:ankyrin repeat protein
LNDRDEVITMLLDGHAAIDHANKQGETPLMRAAEKGSEFAVLELLARGADPTLTDFTGRTALDRAKENRRNQIVQIFRKAGIQR